MKKKTTENAGDFQSLFDALVTPKLRTAVEASCHKHDVLLEPIKTEIVASILQAHMLDLVADGKLEIVGFKNGQIIFK